METTIAMAMATTSVAASRKATTPADQASERRFRKEDAHRRRKETQ
jgi:hypothetical protein